MKNRIFERAGYSLMIGALGVLLPLGAAQADSMDQERMNTEHSGETWSSEPRTTTTPSDSTFSSGSDTTHPTGRYDQRTAPQGAQGPMRSDMYMSDREREIRNRLFPLPGEGDARTAIGDHNATGKSY